MDNGINEEIEVQIVVDKLIMDMEMKIIIEEDYIIIINNQEEDHVVVDIIIHMVEVNDRILNIIEVEEDIEAIVEVVFVVIITIIMQMDIKHPLNINKFIQLLHLNNNNSVINVFFFFPVE